MNGQYIVYWEFILLHFIEKSWDTKDNFKIFKLNINLDLHPK